MSGPHSVAATKYSHQFEANNFAARNPSEISKATDFDREAAWAKCADDVWTHEEVKVEKWSSEIDTLLVFAGLFSAVLTSFIVQYYPTLQGSSQGSGNVQEGGKVAATSVVINALWFLALLLSLAAASIGITVKQWLSQYIVSESIAPRQRARIWLLRHDSLVAWRVPEIIASLPLLLQLALGFFLVGIVILLWTMNRVVSVIVMAPVAILLLFTIATAFIPTFVPGCPYKSQQAWWLYRLLRRFTLFDGTIGRHLKGRWRFLLDALRSIQPTKDWTDRENHWLRQDRHEVSRRYQDLKVLVAADKLMRDDTFMESVILPSLQESSTHDALPAFFDLVESRAHLVMPGEPGQRGPRLKWFAGETDGETILAMGNLTLSMLIKRMQGGMHASWSSDLARIFSVLDELLEATPGSRPSLFLRLLGLCCEYRSAGGLLYLTTRHGERFKYVVDDISDDQGIKLVDSIIGILSNRPQGPSDVEHAKPDLFQTLNLLERLLVHWPRSRAMSTLTIVYGRVCTVLETTDLSAGIRSRLIDIVYMVYRHSSHVNIPAPAVKCLVVCLVHLFPDHRAGSQHKMRLLEVTGAFLSRLEPNIRQEDVHTILPVLRNAIGLQLSSQDFWETRSYLRSLLKIYLTVAKQDSRLVNNSDYMRLYKYVATKTATWRKAQWWDKCAAELDSMLDELQRLRSEPISRTTDDGTQSTDEAGEMSCVQANHGTGEPNGDSVYGQKKSPGDDRCSSTTNITYPERSPWKFQR
ncbi:hypothetical protein DAEQUDRAFT_29345 [Daedalea quercina L-15889]|uniref:DUF6535 domain-containing protein n=1 Tax=Daedalea quercina L-15889 TaxID=1314783 RepID=A0A165SPF2_9APHY|nr:hypothetical protein DAEQUDRAFT_29345 [Daedalea quercina L-15889]